MAVFRHWARLEREAVSLCTYECRLVPGLLQSEGYVRALGENDIPPMTDDELEAMVNARLKRQVLLGERPNSSFDFVVEESVFMRRLGGADLTRDLLGHVMNLCSLRNTTLQVMPADAEHHAGLAGPLALLEAPDGRRHAYVEGQESGRLLSDPKEVSRIQRRYARLRSQALSPKDSLSLLKRMRGAL